MKKHLPIIAVVLIFVIGIGILAYPLVSSVINNMDARNDEGQYYHAAQKRANSEIIKMIREAKDYNRRLVDTVVITDPFDVESYNKSNKEYKKLLSPDAKGTIGYVKIPKIDVSLPIYHGTSQKILAQGAGHLENTSLPVGGKGTHSVISAHSAFPDHTFFDYLTEIKEGDEFYIKVLDRTLKYKVDQIKVVLPEDTSDLHIDRDKDYVTLLTCTPYSVNTHRLLVRGERVPYDEKEQIDVTTITAGDDAIFFLGYKIPYVVAGIVIVSFVLIVVMIVILAVRGKKKRVDKNEPSS